MNKLIATILTLAFGITLGAQEHGDILITGGTVITITGDILEDTDVLIRNGKINQIGEGLSASGDIKTIDASGKYVMPGIIDAHSHIALDVVNEATDPNTANVDVGDVINPYDIGIYRALAGGVTISHAMHGLSLIHI